MCLHAYMAAQVIIQRETDEEGNVESFSEAQIEELKVRVCVCVCVYTQTYIHTCIHTYIHTYAHTYE